MHSGRGCHRSGAIKSTMEMKFLWADMGMWHTFGPTMGSGGMLNDWGILSKHHTLHRLRQSSGRIGFTITTWRRRLADI